MKINNMKQFQNFSNDVKSLVWYKKLSDIVGPDNVLYNFSERLAYARDRSPHANLKYRFGKLPSILPLIVVSPKSYYDISQILILANEYLVPVVPYGSGSGVMGGAIPTNNGITLDLKNLKKILALDRINCTVTTQAGINGELFEASLNKDRLTLGHYPQSLNMSTVGGWLACRSAGQASSRYRSIEDMVIGLKVILPDGKLLEVKPVPRRAVGPSIKDLFLGSEGTLGIIVEATFRIWPYPEKQSVHVVGFKDYLTGLEAIRRIMQAEIRPSVIRLYDEHESASKIKNFPVFKNSPCICMFIFSGLTDLVEVEKKIALKQCHEVGGLEGPNEPAYQWIQKRFESLSAEKVFNNRMMDTIEVASSWTNLHSLYESIKDAVLSVNMSNISFGAHWSHFYSDGACMYVTFHLPAEDHDKANSIHANIWEKSMDACIKAGGTISHHHGIGIYRNKWIKKELSYGHEILSRIKKSIDPNFIMNPGKLSLK